MDGQAAVVEVYGHKRTVLVTPEGVKPGDWVLIYGPVAIARLEPDEVKETLELLEKMRGPTEEFPAESSG